MQLPHSFALSHAPHTVLGYRKDGRPIRFIGGGDGTGDGTGTGSAGTGGGAPTVNEHGYPDGKPVSEMDPAHQVAYWKHHARKHEQRANAAPDAAELERLRAAEAELEQRKAAEMSDAERVQAEKAAAEAAAATAKAEAEAATRKALLLEIAFDKGLTPAQAARLQGSTKEELEADADELLKLFGTDDKGQSGTSGAGSPRVGGPRGGDVTPTSTVSAGAERYRQKHGK
jgi:membrane protein involved in colicin uptake